MKAFTFAAVLASVSGALAADQYYTLYAHAPGQPFHGVDLKVIEYFWKIGGQSNSTCGDVSPAVNLGPSTLMGVYNNGQSHQQHAYIDNTGFADGLLALAGLDSTVKPGEGFTLIGAEQDALYLYVNGHDTSDRQFLAYKDMEYPGSFFIYPEKSYSSMIGKEGGIRFEIKAKQVSPSGAPCVYS